MRIILHIGMTKTGTTSVQNTLADHREALRARGVNYSAIMGRRDCQFRFAARVLDDEGRREVIAESVLNPDAFQLIADADVDSAFEQEMEDTHTTIVSAETLFRSCSTPERTAAVKRYVDRWFDEVTVVVYLRRQDRHMASWFAQEMKSGRPGPEGLEEIAKADHPGYDYAASLAPWAERFGAASLIVRPFERGQLKGGDTVTDFLDATGLGDVIEGERPASENDSLSAEATAFARNLNAHMPWDDPSPAMQRLRALVRRVGLSLSQGHPGPALPAPLAREVLDRYAAANEEVARLYLDRPDGVLFRDEPPKDEGGEAVAITPERSAEFTAAILRCVLDDMAETQNAAARLRESVARQRDAALHQRETLVRRQEIIDTQQRTIAALRRQEGNTPAVAPQTERARR